MIPDNIKSIFNFIDFLHKNIDNFNTYKETMLKVESLQEQKSKLNHRENFKNKIKCQELQTKIDADFKIIKKNIINPIREKVQEFNFCDWDDTSSIWNNNIGIINDFKQNFEIEDVSVIQEYSKKYIEFRENTNHDYYQNIFFNGLDEILEILFNFFSETDLKKIPPFKKNEIKPVQKDEKSFNEEIEELSSQENKFWKGIPLNFVIEHFKVFKETTNKNGETFLSDKQFISFIKKGFLNHTNEKKQTFNLGSNEKTFVLKRFYEFFNISVAKYNHPNKKERFIDLVINSFDNWDDKESIKYLLKPNKTKKNW